MTNRYNHIILPIFLLADLISISVAFLVAYWFKFGALPSLSISDSNYGIFIAACVLTWFFLSLFINIQHTARSRKEMEKNSKRFLMAQLLFCSLMSTLVVLTRFTDISRQFFGSFLFLQFALLFIARIARQLLMKKLRAAGHNIRYLSLIGTAEESQRIEQWLTPNPELGYVYANSFPSMEDPDFQNVSWQSVFAERKNKGCPDHILMSNSCPQDVQETVVEAAEDYGARVHLIQKVSKTLARRTGLELFGPFAVESIRSEPLRIKCNRIIKRGFDVVFSSVVLLSFFSWFYVLAGFLIKVTSKGSVLIHQRRPGRDSGEFICYKFRTMVNDPNAEQGEGEITQKDDPRITLIGRFLRKTNLDELPQFINVLFGDMSVVGPRPLPIKEDREVRQKLKKYPLRQFVKPGITGYAAINGYRGSTPDMELMQKRVDLDIWYVENWSIWLDLKICAITIWQMLTLNTGAH